MSLSLTQKLQKLWEANRDVRHAIPMAVLNRLPVAIAMRPVYRGAPTEDRFFPAKIELFSLDDIPVGHWGSLRRVFTQARASMLVASAELPIVQGTPQKGRNVDWGCVPFDSEDVWLMDATFSHKVPSPFAGTVRKVDDGTVVSYFIHTGKDELPVCELSAKHRADIRCIADSGDVVEKGDPLLVVTRPITGCCFIERLEAANDVLNTRKEPFANKVFNKLSNLMTYWSLFQDDRWMEHVDDVVSKCEYLLRCERREGRLGTLGSELVNNVLAAPLELEQYMAGVAAAPLPEVRVLAYVGPEKLHLRVPEGIQLEGGLLPNKILEVLAATDQLHFTEEGGMLFKPEEVPECLRPHVTGHRFDLRPFKADEDEETRTLMRLLPRTDWTKFSFKLGDVAVDLTPTDRRFHWKQTSKRKLLKAKKWREKQRKRNQTA